MRRRPTRAAVAWWSMTSGRLIPVMHPRATGWPKRLEPSDIDHAAYLPLGEALARTYPFDAHACQYSVPEISRRLGANDDREESKLTIWDRLPEGGIPMVAFFIDVEPSLHATPTAEWYAGEATKLRCLLTQHPAGFVYTTRGGYRVVYQIEPQFICTPTDAAQWSLHYTTWIEYLAQRCGIAADGACKDWQRYFRLPRVVREGVAQQPEMYGDPSAIGFWDPPVSVPKASPPPARVDVATPTWDETMGLHLHRATLDEYRKRLRAYSRRKSESRHPRDQERAEIVRRILEGEALTTEAGVAMRGRHNTVHRAAQILGSVIAEAGPEVAVAIVRPSIEAIGNLEPKGLDHYLDKFREDYVEGARFLAEQRERDRQLLEEIGRSAKRFS